ncbi:MAG: DUF1700 domain-containing protein [Porcipelethomonas sp.]
MTKYDYLTRLKHYLQPLPIKERNAAMKYYDKYLTDAGPENEQYAMSNLGSPKELAEKIIRKNRSTLSGMVRETKNNVRSAQNRLDAGKKKQSCLLTVLLSPIWIGVVLLFVLALAAFALFVAGLLVLMAVSGIALLAMSIPYIANLTSVGLTTMGISLIFMGIPVLLFLPAMNLVFNVIKKAVTGAFSGVNKRLKGKAAEK